MTVQPDLHALLREPDPSPDAYWDHRRAAWTRASGTSPSGTADGAADAAGDAHAGHLPGSDLPGSGRPVQATGPVTCDPWRLLVLAAADGTAVPARVWLPPLPAPVPAWTSRASDPAAVVGLPVQADGRAPAVPQPAS